jgi:hypothetical protein
LASQLGEVDINSTNILLKKKIIKKIKIKKIGKNSLKQSTFFGCKLLIVYSISCSKAAKIKKNK